MRLIDADKLKDSICEECTLYWTLDCTEKIGGECVWDIIVHINKAPTIDPVKHGHWDSNHRCSLCGKDDFCKITNIRPHYDYDWEENLVETGEVEYDEEWANSEYCPHCGAKNG